MTQSRNQTYSFDLDKARALLQQAGVSSLETDVVVSSASPINALGFLQIYQADLAKIGVTLNIKAYESAAWAAAVLGHTYRSLYATVDVVANLLPINNLNGPTWRPTPNNTDWNAPEWRDMMLQSRKRGRPRQAKSAVRGNE